LHHTLRKERSMALVDRIKYDFPPNVLVEKWRRPDSDHSAEDLILGAQLIVNESQEAIFFKGGQALDLFGPGTHTLSSANLPLLGKLINLPFGGKTPFTAELYFINKTAAFAQDWGTTSPIMLLDPRYRVTIPLRGYGQYAVRVENSREFVVQIVGSSAGALASETASSMLESPIVTCIQQAFGDYLVQKRITALELPAHALGLAEHVIQLLRSHFKTFGIALVNFTIESINFDPQDKSVVRLRGMLDDAARLDVVGDAFRRNQDFYRVDRQFDVLQGAGESGGAAGSVMGAAMGVGMGFGIAGPAGDMAKQSMTPEPAAPPRCANCNAPYKPGSQFCNKCGEKLGAEIKLCPECKAENVSAAKFCNTCGRPMGVLKCRKCGADLGSAAKFCNECGEKV
jgi:membrane protease subunit (stomatin/prohibitin family)